MRYDEGSLRASGHDHIIYDGVDLNSYFEVTSFGLEALPPVEPITTQIPGKAGQHYYSRQVGARTITLRLMAKADSSDPLRVAERWRELSPLINKDEPRRLYLDSEMYVDALLTGETSIEFFGERGAVELTFSAFDPYFHGREHTVALKAGDNTFMVVSQCEVWPVVTVTGATAPLRVQNKTTADEVRVPAVGGLPIKIDMENMKAYSGSNYVPVDIEHTDFYSLPANELATIWLSSGSGTLTYEERAL